MYDTHSWAYNISSSYEGGMLKALTDYKLDLFISLEHNDTLPETYSMTPAGQDFMLAYLGRDIRNILKWLRISQKGIDSNRSIQKTYNSVQSYIEGYIDGNPVPLGSRLPRGVPVPEEMEGQDGLGFRKTAFYQMVQEGFTIGRYGTNKAEAIFGTDLSKDRQFAFSNYFWFMYGILPRNGIKFTTLERGLTTRGDLKDFEIRHTIQFLALVFNIHSESVTIDGDDGIKDLRLIDVNKDDVYLPVTRSKFEIKGTYLQQTNESRQDRPQTNAPISGETNTTVKPNDPFSNKIKEDLNSRNDPTIKNDDSIGKLFTQYNKSKEEFFKSKNSDQIYKNKNLTEIKQNADTGSTGPTIEKFKTMTNALNNFISEYDKKKSQK
jgi:cell fate (sporulation/competence/biofilm development) regulator YlbF (YheA/YmcA/DUF963 family)